MNWSLYLIDKLWPIFLAVVLTQLVIQKLIEIRKPKLGMVPEGTFPNTLKRVSHEGVVLPELPYHYWRIKVQHINILWYLAWLIKSRESALQCKADLTFYTSNGQALFTMQGRWANTMEVSLVSPLNQQEKIVYPDTINIGYHSYEPLDCIVKFDSDNAAYAWNNEAYAFPDCKNPRYKLGMGTYKVHVRLSGQNFRQFITKFNIVISGDWQGSSLTPAGRD
jgi:hypothetical protein